MVVEPYIVLFSEADLAAEPYNDEVFSEEDLGLVRWYQTPLGTPYDEHTRHVLKID